MRNKKRIMSKLLWISMILIFGLAAFPIAASAQMPTQASADVQVANDPKLGPILVDGSGRTLYLFMADKPGMSSCSGACLAAWPAFSLPSGKSPTGSPAVTGKLGTITRPEGTVQVTVNNLPLYYFIKDMKPGDVTGQGINAFGGLWWAVKPDGTPNTGG